MVRLLLFAIFFGQLLAQEDYRIAQKIGYQWSVWKTPPYPGCQLLSGRVCERQNEWRSTHHRKRVYRRGHQDRALCLFLCENKLKRQKVRSSERPRGNTSGSARNKKRFSFKGLIRIALSDTNWKKVTNSRSLLQKD